MSETPRHTSSSPLRAPGTSTRIAPPAKRPAEDEESKDGWGYADTRFVVRPNGAVVLTGDRYPISNTELPSLLPWMSKTLDAPLAYDNRNEPHFPPQVPASRLTSELRERLSKLLREDQISEDDLIRLRRGHGHTGGEIWAIRYETLPRVPDVVAFPESHEEVVALVQLARELGACVVPFGGGTNVTEALRLSVHEERPVIALDMRRMCRVLWIDPINRMACIEAGATGLALSKELAAHGMTMGHEPDSLEFSTLGGWIATNASGMKKNRYGNIEELVLDMRVVTADGVVERPSVGPRESIGQNPKNVMFGSEGNLGIVTSATVRLFPLPEVQRYGSVLLPDLEAGLKFLYDLTASGAVPASVRVVDNTQFQFGQALKPAADGALARAKSRFEKLLVTKIKGYDPTRMTVATIVFEGTADEVAFQERVLYRIAKKHGGMKAGAKNGERGYQLTFGIAYIRDLTFEHWAIAESFETSVPWSRALELYERVRARVQREHRERGLPGNPFFTGRITQVYPTGVCIYFYLGFYAKGVADPVGQYRALEDAAREEILASGGSLSHHHGVGKIRQHFLKDIYSEGARAFTRKVKDAVDPENVFGTDNHGVRGLVELDEHAAEASSSSPTHFADTSEAS